MRKRALLASEVQELSWCLVENNDRNHSLQSKLWKIGALVYKNAWH